MSNCDTTAASAGATKPEHFGAGEGDTQWPTQRHVWLAARVQSRMGVSEALTRQRPPQEREGIPRRSSSLSLLLAIILAAHLHVAVR